MSSSQRYLQECCKGQAVSKKSQQCAQMLSTHYKVPYPQCRWIRTERTMCAGFAAHGRSGQHGRELHWSAPVKLAAVQSSPWLRAGPTSPSKHPHDNQDKRPTNTQPRNNNPKDRSAKTEKRPKTRGGKKNRQGPQRLSSTQKVKNEFSTEATDRSTERAGGNTRQPTKRQGGTKKLRTHRKARAARTRRGGQHRGGQDRTQTQESPHRGRRQGAGRQQRTGGERARKDQSGYSSALVDVQRGTWNIKDEYLSAAAQSNAKTLQSGVEGSNTPHRAKPLVPQCKRRNEDKEPLTLHTTSWQPSSTRGTILGGRHQ